jgi:hypothetical protein
MDVMSLLNQAQAAGLAVTIRGDQLVVRGPKRAEAQAQELLQYKGAVMAALASITQPSPKVVPAEPLAVKRLPRHRAQATSGSITYQNTIYEVRQFAGMWFHSRNGGLDWTCAEDAFAAMIEREVCARQDVVRYET